MCPICEATGRRGKTYRKGLRLIATGRETLDSSFYIRSVRHCGQSVCLLRIHSSTHSLQKTWPQCSCTAPKCDLVVALPVNEALVAADAIWVCDRVLSCEVVLCVATVVRCTAIA